MDVLFALAGLALLVVAGDALVKSAVALALRMGIPVLIVGLTVVAFGTSAPELLVSVQAALRGSPGIAVGNVVGSNIANVWLVVGLPALFAAIRPRGGEGMRRNYLQMIAASCVLIVLCAAGPLRAWHAAVLLGLFLLWLVDAFVAARDGRVLAADGIGDAPVSTPAWRLGLMLAFGLVGLPVGAHLLIEGAIGLAVSFGISEEVIGLTMVAVGTSLPELAATTMAAMRRETDVAIGNVIGSNLFNILLILGVTSLFGPVEIAPAFLQRDLWVMLAASLALAPFVFRSLPIGRAVGAVFLLAYFVYMLALFHQGGTPA